jgi:TolB-like protein/AraC-like DNA-binding protein
MNEESSQDQSFLDRLFKTIEAHYEDEQFGVSELAMEMGFSRSQLHRRLHSLTSKSASQVIREYRLEKAREMLEKDVANVSEIAYQVGFGSPSYFNTCFSDFYGYSPGETKKMAEGTLKRLSRKINRKLAYTTSAALMILIVLLVIFFAGPNKENTVELDRSIAVMPFKNASADKEMQYFVDGMMEDVRNKLALIGDLRVVSKTSTEKYRTNDLTAKEIGKELKVNYLLEGTVQRQGKQLKIHAQLIEVETDKHIWVNTFIGDLIDVFKVQSRIAEAIAEELKTNITPHEKQRIEKSPTDNMEAYNIYLRAYEYHKRYDGDPSLNTAIKLYQDALELDPEFALAYLYLGEALVDLKAPGEYFKDSRDDTMLYFINKALEIDPDLAEAYMHLGVNCFINGRYEEGVIDLQKSIELNPSLGRSYRELGFYYSNSREYLLALKYYNIAKKLSIGEIGFGGLLRRIGETYMRIADYEKASAIYEESVIYDPIKGYFALNWLNRVFDRKDKIRFYGDKICAMDSNSCLGIISDYYMDSGNYELALHYYESDKEMAKVKGQNVRDRLDQKGFFYYKLGKKEEALDYFNEWIEYVNKVIERGDDNIYAPNWAYNDLARVYAFLGDRDKAFDKLYQMEANITGEILTYMQHDPFYENLWDDEEFKDYIQRNEKKFDRLMAEVDRLEKLGEI